MAITSISTIGKLNREQTKLIFGVDNTIEFGHGSTFVHNLHLPLGYLLCASRELTAELFTRFRCDDYFTITDPMLFRDACERAISEYHKVVFSADGPVSYVAEKATRMTRIQDLLRLGPSIRQARLEEYFRKPSDGYQLEAEHRFVFGIESDKAQAPILLQFTEDEIASCCSFEK